MSEQDAERDHQCVRCGEEFDSMTARTMHVIRQRCPEIDSEEDVESADTAHAFEEMIQSLESETA